MALSHGEGRMNGTRGAGPDHSTYHGAGLVTRVIDYFPLGCFIRCCCNVIGPAARQRMLCWARP